MSDVSVVLDRAARLNRLIFVAIAAVSVFSLFALARGATGNGGWLGFPGRHLYVVTSGSMSPAIDVGDAVLVRPVSGEQSQSLTAGTVVTFRAANNPSFLITHRIIAVGTSAGGRRFYETRGDANRDTDASILEPQRIEGVVTRVVPRLGSVLVALRTPRVLAIFVGAWLLFEAAVVSFRLARRSVHDPRRDDAAGQPPNGSMIPPQRSN